MLTWSHYIKLGIVHEWLWALSKGDVVDSQIISIDVLALSSKGETYTQI
jgi:hypothetical protein